jgi:hypothetical protein
MVGDRQAVPFGHGPSDASGSLGDMEHPKRVGDRTTIAVMLALEHAGYALSVPFGENTRYDSVIDDGSTLSRVQCKTGRLRSGAVIFPTCSSYAHHRSSEFSTRDYIGEIDYFAVYCAATSGVYLVPITDAAMRRSAALRIDAPRNSQRRKIRFAADYRIGTIASSEPRVSSGAPGSCA